MDKSYFILDTNHPSDIRLFAGGQVIGCAYRRCPKCNAKLPILDDRNPQIALDHLGRQGFVEHLWNSFDLPIFRSDVIDHWFTMGLSGFITKTVEIIGWSQNKKRQLPENIPYYHWLIPSNHIQLTKPPPADMEDCDCCGFVKYSFPKISVHLSNGIRIDEKTLGEADFYGLLGYNFIFCSRKVLEVTLPKKYKYFAFVPTSKWLTWDEFDYRKWEPKPYDDYVKRFLIRDLSDLEKLSP